MKKKRAFTLLEIMIVIFLIGLIGSVIGYNMKGSMDEGKAFRTKHAIKQMKDIFELEIAKGTDAKKIAKDPEKCLSNSGIVKSPKKLVKDGWGKPFQFDIDDDSVTITSIRYNEFKEKKKKTGYDQDDDD